MGGWSQHQHQRQRALANRRPTVRPTELSLCDGAHLSLTGPDPFDVENKEVLAAERARVCFVRCGSLPNCVAVIPHSFSLASAAAATGLENGPRRFNWRS